MRPVSRPIAAIVLAGQCLAPAPVFAADAAPPTPAIGMQHTSWTAAEGALAGITGIAQTPDGWLWIGSTAGLFRFDGVRFQRAPAALAPLSANIADMGVLPDGTLWLAYKFGGASLMKAGQMRHFRVGEHDMPGGTPGGLARDGDGRIWLASSTNGLWLLGADGNWQPGAARFGAPDGSITSMLLDRRGTLWARSYAGVFALPRNAARFERRRGSGGYGKLGEHPDGSIWTSDMLKPGLHLLDGGPGTDPQAWAVPVGISAFGFDHAGRLWQPNYGGVSRFAARGSAPPQSTGVNEGLSGQHGYAVFEDAEHNVWVGTENGLDRFRDYRLQVTALPKYLGSARPLAARPGGGVWIDRSFVARPDAVPESFAPPASSADLTVSLYAAPDGTLWSGGLGELWKVRDGRREVVALPPDLPDPKRTAVLSIAGDGAGAVWISVGRRGVYALRDGRWIAHGGIPALASLATTVVAGDGGGRLWIGTSTHELVLLEGGKARRFGSTDGLTLGSVLAILPDGEGAWIGGEDGVAYFDGRRFTPLVGRGGDPFAGVTGLVFGADGTLWLNGGAGISAIAPAELRSALTQPGYRVQFERLDYRDGMPGPASGITPLPSAVRSADGVLWFSTLAGTVGFDPARLPRNRRVPPVYVTALKVDGKEYDAREGLRVGPRVGTLEIDFTALGYRAPERMRFRYRLDGVDYAWQEPERRRAAYYTNLAPGHYRFRVAASNDDGVWNEGGAVLSFEVAPSLTQTNWFRVLCAGAALAALWLLHRLRMRRAARRLAAKMETRLAERERIARELHDTLLQSIQGLIWKTRAAAHRLDADARRPIDDALETANQVLAEGRDRVAGLRGESVLQAGLAGAIEAFGTPLARQAGAHFEVRVRGRVTVLEGALCDEVFAIAREAIWNAFAHARPRSVVVTLDYAADALAMTVADDGVGIPAGVLRNGAKPGHWGMPGMRERAARLGRLEVESAQGRGTTWTLTLATIPADA